MDGGVGNDTLIGDAGNDTVLGGAGIDDIRGGTGDDHLDGGAGFDVYRWVVGDGNDTIIGSRREEGSGAESRVMYDALTMDCAIGDSPITLDEVIAGLSFDATDLLNSQDYLAFLPGERDRMTVTNGRIVLFGECASGTLTLRGATIAFANIGHIYLGTQSDTSGKIFVHAGTLMSSEDHDEAGAGTNWDERFYGGGDDTISGGGGADTVWGVPATIPWTLAQAMTKSMPTTATIWSAAVTAMIMVSAPPATATTAWSGTPEPT